MTEKNKQEKKEKKAKDSPARLVKTRRMSEEEEYLFEVKAVKQESLRKGSKLGNWI